MYRNPGASVKSFPSSRLPVFPPSRLPVFPPSRLPVFPSSRLPSWPLPQRVEIAELLGRLARDPRVLVGAADGDEVAPGAGARVRRGRQESQLDGAIDDFQRFE